MSIRESLFFTFNNIRSDEMGLINVNMSTGMQSEPFAHGRSIKEQRIRGRDRGYFQEVELQPLEFTVSFAFIEEFSTERLRTVARWLTTKYYAPLQFFDGNGEDSDKIYYCMMIDSPELVLSSGHGYINLKFRCIDAYSYTSVYTKTVDLTTNPTAGTLYTFENFGDAECKPLIEIYKIGAGNVNFYNQSNGNAEMSMNGLANLETVIIDCESRIITTDIPLTYRYGNLVGDYLTIPIYNNYILIKGTCKVKFTYQLKRIQ